MHLIANNIEAEDLVPELQLAPSQLRARTGVSRAEIARRAGLPYDRVSNPHRLTAEERAQVRRVLDEARADPHDAEEARVRQMRAEIAQRAGLSYDQVWNGRPLTAEQRARLRRVLAEAQG